MKALSIKLAKLLVAEIAAKENQVPKTGDSMWDAKMLRDNLAGLVELRSLGTMGMANKGGNHLGTIRNFIQRKCTNGERVTWGSHDYLQFRGELTVSDLEMLACDIAASTLQEVFSVFSQDTIDKLLKEAGVYQEKENVSD